VQSSAAQSRAEQTQAAGPPVDAEKGWGTFTRCPVESSTRAVA
jgi:hypothetical protein